MIKIDSSGNKIKENKYKILRMSLLLGNGEDREETINNFEDAAREIDAMNDEVYLKDVDSKFYDTLTLEEEEKKLTNLVDFIGGRVEQRESLIEDFSNVTGFELINLPIIKYQDRLDEYKSRLGYIKEYLGNTERIKKLKEEIDDFDNKLNDAYVKKAKSEETNTKAEDDLFNRFKLVVNNLSLFKNLNKDNASEKLNEVVALTEDSKKSLDIFNKSYATLNQAGISGAEKDEYLSYVNSAKEAYYTNKEDEYLLRIYVLLSEYESEYSKILFKRNSLNDLIYERTNLRRELKISGTDILNGLYDLIDRQYDDIKSQSINIDNIDTYTREIDIRKNEVSGLEQDNQKVEILSLLREFCIIDTYDNNKEDAVDIENDLKIDNNIDDLSFNNDEGIKEEITNNKNDDIFSNISTNSSEDIFSSNDIEKKDDNDSSIDNLLDNSKEESIEEGNDNEKEKESIEEDELDISDATDNQIIAIDDASNMNIDEAIEKSSSVMRRVGEMLGVKVEEGKAEEKEESVFNEVNEEKVEAPKEDVLNDQLQDNNDNNIFFDSKPDEPIVEEPKEEDNIIPADIFGESNFDADPELNNKLDSTKESNIPENPLFNSTLDDIMENSSVEDAANVDNDFWFNNEETPLDLNSLPDLPNNNDNFFNANNNGMPSLDFPDLEASGVSVEEDKNGNN